MSQTLRDSDRPHETATDAPENATRARGGRLGPGVTIGRYRIEALLGVGGMGEVYEALDSELGRRVALKVLGASASASASGGPESAHARMRMLRGARAQARVRDQHVAVIYDVGSDGDIDYIAVEYIEGEDLAQWLGRSPSRAEIIDAFVQAGRGLVAVHAAGLVHRDVKPSNILIERGGRVVLADFGLARWGDDARGRATTVNCESSGVRAVDEASTVTDVGARVGTPRYMSPEQHAGDPVDERSDQYSFCVALARALGESVPADAITVDLRAPRGAPATPKINPDPIQRVLARGLALRPSARYPSMRALLDVLAPAPLRARRWRWIGIGGVLVAGLVVGWFALGHRSSGAAERCGDEPPVWTADRAFRIKRAFLATGHSTAGLAADRLDQAVRDRAASWDRENRDACAEPDDVRRAARRACLAQSRAELDAFLALLESADLELVTAAVRIPGGSPDSCRRARAAAGMVLPESPPIARRVVALRGALAVVLAQVAALRADLATAGAARAVASARALGYPPVLAEALQVQGRAAEVAEDIATAAAAYDEAAIIAEGAGHDRVRAEALVGLVRSHLNASSDQVRGRELARRARAAIARVADPELVAQLDLADVRLMAPSDPAYEATLRRVVAGIEARGAVAELRDAVPELMTLLRAKGDHEGALAVAKRLLALEQAQTGELSPFTVMAHARVARALRALERWDDARAQRAPIERFRATVQGRAVLRGMFRRTQAQVTRELQVRVVDAAGVPVAGAEVVVGEGLRGDGAFVDGELDETFRQLARLAVATTDNRGQLVFRDLASERRMWLIAELGSRRSKVHAIEPGPDPRAGAQLTAVLDDTGAVRGRVVGDVGDHAHIEVSAADSGLFEVQFDVPVRRDGSFAVPRMAPGRWRVALIRADGGANTFFGGQVIDVRAGRSTDVEVVIPPTGIPLSVRVLGGPGVRLEAAVVIAVPGVVEARQLDALAKVLGARLAAGRVGLTTVASEAVAELRIDRGPYTLCVVPLAGDPDDPWIERSITRGGPEVPVECRPVSRVGETPMTLVASTAFAP